MTEKNKEDAKRWCERNREKVKKQKHQSYILNSEEVKERVKQWQENNPEKVKSYKMKWHKDNPQYNREYYLKNIDKIKEYEKNNKERKDILFGEYRIKYRLEHKKEIAISCKKYRQEHKEESRIYQNNRRKTDLKFNLNHKIRNSIRKALKGNKNGKHWEELVGYSLDALMNRLFQTMPEGYAWQDYMEGRLHLDHIIPKSAFNYDSVKHADFKKCWSLNNLRLLPASENMSKGSKLIKPFQPCLKISIAGV